MTDTGRPGGVREVVGVFLRLGVVAFGGPAAHIAMMRDELVRRRAWVTDDRFADLVGATNLVPGPNSTELAIHLGHERAGWRGLLWAGVCFIVPAAVITTVLAWAYVEYGETPTFTNLLYGVVPVVIGIIVHALTGLLSSVLHVRPGARPRWPLVAVTAGALAAYLLGVHELAVLAAAAGLGVAAYAVRQAAGHGLVGVPLLLVGAGDVDRLPTLFWTMLKIGAVLYGSGYVLLAFLEGDFVDRLGWVTQEQLTDAISIGQVTPGPVFTTATFLGYLVAGVPGAVVATVAIFLPSFGFVALLTRITTWLRTTAWTAWALDAVNAAALALMAGVTWLLAGDALVDVPTVLLCLGAVAAMLTTRVNSAWLVAAGAVAGVVLGTLS